MTYNVNPVQLIQMIKGGTNPQQLMINILEQQMRGNPIGENLLNLARNNRGQEIEQVARNLCAQRRLDFDKEFADFKHKIGLQ